MINRHRISPSLLCVYLYTPTGLPRSQIVFDSESVQDDSCRSYPPQGVQTRNHHFVIMQQIFILLFVSFHAILHYCNNHLTVIGKITQLYRLREGTPPAESSPRESRLVRP